MVETRRNIWQFPVMLKLSIIWIYLICVFHFYEAVTGLVSNFSINLWDLAVGLVFLGLANGLVSANNNSRIWAVRLVNSRSLIRIYMVAIIVIKNINPIGTWRFFSYEAPMTKIQVIILLALNLVINAGFILTLAKSETKEIFQHRFWNRKQNDSLPIPPPRHHRRFD